MKDKRSLCPAPRGGAQFRHVHKVAHRGSQADRLLSFFTQLAVVTIWKSLATLSAPLGRLFALYYWTGKATYKLSTWIQRLLLRVVGWLSSAAFPPSHWLRQWSRYYSPVDVKKWHLVVAAFLTLSVASSLVRKWRERFDERLVQLRQVRERMKTATSYPEWRQLAQQLDQMEVSCGGEGAGRISETLYDAKVLRQKLAHLQKYREHGNVREMMFALRLDLVRNLANIAKSGLSDHFYKVPKPIQDYIQEVKEQLVMLTEWPDAGVAADEKLNFFRETRHAFGRTALLLSGGGGLGSFHIGVIKGLFEHRMLPRVLAGSSVGSIVAGIAGTRTDDELRETFAKMEQFDASFFNNNRAVELVTSFINKGTLHDIDFLVRKLRLLLGEFTFLEAYERTGRILNVTVCAADTNEPPRLLNYLTAPQAVVWSAVAASSAFPGLFPAQHLLAKNARGETVRFSAPSTHESMQGRWRDGSLELDLPTYMVGEMFNCNHFIVSQTNPHIVPLVNFKKGLSRKWGNLFELELRHRCAQMQWLLPQWMPTKWLTLFTQPWEGDVTVVLPSTLWNLGRAILNPTQEDLLHAVKQGELAIWEKLSAIQANCAIEATLDACLARLTNKARERPLHGLSSRIPSWMSMSTIGSPAIASWGGAAGAAFERRTPGGAGSSRSAASSPERGAAAAAGSSGGGAGAALDPAAAAASALGGEHGGYHHDDLVQQQQPGHAIAAAYLTSPRGGGAMAASPPCGRFGGLPPLGVPPTIHESGPDERPPRVASWGGNDVADSVADFPRAPPSPAAPRSSCGGGGSVCSSLGDGSDNGDDEPRGAGAGSGGRRRRPASRRLLGQLDCVDASASMDIWSSLLPLSFSALVLEAAGDGHHPVAQSLDVIAP